MKCQHCGQAIEDAWQICPFCTARLQNGEPGARVVLSDSVAREVTQVGAGTAGEAMISDSTVGRISQEVHVDGAAEDLAVEAVRELASVAITDSVVKEVHQVVNLYMGSGQSLDSVFGARGARGLRSKRIYAACGREILVFRIADGDAGRASPAGVYSLPDSMGSVRSVRLAKAGDRLMILAGARLGVVAFDARTSEAMVYAFPCDTRYGANAALIYGEHLYATHSDFGLLRWPIGGGESTSIHPEVFETAATVRALQVNLRGEMLVCAGNCVYGIDVSNPDTCPVEYRCPGKQRLVGSLECGEHVYAAASDGKILRWDADMPHHSGAVIADMQCKTYCLSLVQMADGPHLVLGTKSGYVRLIRLVGPQAVVDYHTPGGASIRWAKAAPDLLVASDADGERLFFWHSDDTTRPSQTITIASRAAGRITDLCILRK